MQSIKHSVSLLPELSRNQAKCHSCDPLFVEFEKYPDMISHAAETHASIQSNKHSVSLLFGSPRSHAKYHSSNSYFAKLNKSQSRSEKDTYIHAVRQASNTTTPVQLIIAQRITYNSPSINSQAFDKSPYTVTPYIIHTTHTTRIRTKTHYLATQTATPVSHGFIHSTLKPQWTARHA